MILKLVNDMRSALNAECYFAALAIALMLPDICGKAEYPKMKNGKERYIKWYDENIGEYDKCPKQNENEPVMPHLTGEIVYQLRCCFLHEGNPMIEAGKIKQEENEIDSFILVIESKNEFDIYGDSANVHIKNDKIETRRYAMNVRRLCLLVGAVAEGYYKDNPEKFNFFRYTVEDRRK